LRSLLQNVKGLTFLGHTVQLTLVNLNMDSFSRYTPTLSAVSVGPRAMTMEPSLLSPAVITCTGRSDSKTRSIEGAARRGNGNSPTVHLWPAEYLIIQRCAAEPRRNGGRSNMRRSVTPLWRASDDRRQCYFGSAVVY